MHNPQGGLQLSVPHEAVLAATAAACPPACCNGAVAPNSDLLWSAIRHAEGLQAAPARPERAPRHAQPWKWRTGRPLTTMTTRLELCWYAERWMQPHWAARLLPPAPERLLPARRLHPPCRSQAAPASLAATWRPDSSSSTTTGCGAGAGTLEHRGCAPRTRTSCGATEPPWCLPALTRAHPSSPFYSPGGGPGQAGPLRLAPQPGRPLRLAPPQVHSRGRQRGRPRGGAWLGGVVGWVAGCVAGREGPPLASRGLPACLPRAARHRRYASLSPQRGCPPSLGVGGLGGWVKGAANRPRAAEHAASRPYALLSQHPPAFSTCWIPSGWTLYCTLRHRLTWTTLSATAWPSPSTMCE